jgi:hypothetical protein
VPTIDTAVDGGAAAAPTTGSARAPPGAAVRPTAARRDLGIDVADFVEAQKRDHVSVLEQRI